MKIIANDSDTPQMLLSVFINKNHEIEDINLLEMLECQELGDQLSQSDCYDKYELERTGLLESCDENDCLYHVYARIDNKIIHTCEGPEYDEWMTIITIIKAKDNYTEFLNKQEKYEEQCKLRNMDCQIGSIDTEGGRYYGGCYCPNITYNDLIKLAQMIVKDDIKLAHRIIDKYTASEVLGKYYDSKRAELEEKRAEFKDYIKYNDGLNVLFDKDGYIIKQNGKEHFKITHDEINNLTDEELEMSNEELLCKLYYCGAIADKLKETF